MRVNIISFMFVFSFKKITFGHLINSSFLNIFRAFILHDVIEAEELIKP